MGWHRTKGRRRRCQDEWRRDCQGKTRYRDRAQAKSAASIIRNSGSHLRPYPCQFCRGWHLTSQAERYSTLDREHVPSGLEDSQAMLDGNPA